MNTNSNIDRMRTDASLAQLNELFGPPPVLPDSESIAAYEKMMRRFIECFEPQDFFEMVLMKDVTDGTWEAARCARHKVLLLHRRYCDRREQEARRRKEWAQKKAELASRVAASNAEAATEPRDALDHLVAECDAILQEPATELDHNRVLEASLLYLEKLDKAESRALAKRNKALEQVEWYRDGLGHRLRDVSDALIGEEARDAVAPSPHDEASAEAAIEALLVQPQ